MKQTIGHIYKLFENKPIINPSLGIRMSSEFKNINIDSDKIAESKITDVLS